MNVLIILLIKCKTPGTLDIYIIYIINTHTLCVLVGRYFMRLYGNAFVWNIKVDFGVRKKHQMLYIHTNTYICIEKCVQEDEYIILYIQNGMPEKKRRRRI